MEALQQLAIAYKEFLVNLEDHNKDKQILEDDIEPTFENFMRWLIVTKHF